MRAAGATATDGVARDVGKLLPFKRADKLGAPDLAPAARRSQARGPQGPIPERGRFLLARSGGGRDKGPALPPLGRLNSGEGPSSRSGSTAPLCGIPAMIGDYDYDYSLDDDVEDDEDDAPERAYRRLSDDDEEEPEEEDDDDDAEERYFLGEDDDSD